MKMYSRNCEDKTAAYADVVENVLAALGRALPEDRPAGKLHSGGGPFQSRDSLLSSEGGLTSIVGSKPPPPQLKSATAGLIVADDEADATRSQPGLFPIRTLSGQVQVDDIILDGEIVGVGDMSPNGEDRTLLAF